MKIKNIFIIAALAGTLCACSDLFEPAVENAQSEEQVFTNAESAIGLLGYAYAMLPFETKSATDISTDDAVTNDLTSTNRQMAQGKWTANNDPLSQWQARKATIQYLNTLIKNIEVVKWSSNEHRNIMFKDHILGEAYALRALNMYYLLRNHGGYNAAGELLGVPIVNEPEGPGSSFDRPRDTYEACVQQIFADVDMAMELLPLDYVDITKDQIPAKYKEMGVVDAGEYNVVFGVNLKGRISGRIAEAIKAQTALLASSPAFVEASGITSEDAANLAANVLDRIGGVSGMDPVGHVWYMQKDAINALGSGDVPKEILWRGNKNNGTEDYAFGINQEVNNFPPTLYGSGRINPSQNLVDAFPMANGLPITESGSGYSANDPYAGRDPRFYEYILHNGSIYRDTEIITGSYGSDDNALNRIATSTRTGYYLRKLMRDDCNPDPSATLAQYHYPVYIRYTEIFLAYAEAANEAWGPDGKGTHGYSAYDVIKAIRQRAGVATGGADQYLDACRGNKDMMRELIRNERRIELCFENKRFWDLRRWKAPLNETVKGVDITAAGGKFNYKYIDVESRNYAEHMYFGPIPETEVLRWSNLDQNAGW